MNNYQTKIWHDLMTLCSGDEDAFYFKDHERDDCVYRIFSHRMVSYTDFLQPSALKARGIMFSIDDSGTPIKLVSYPVNKFFNAYENPMVENIEFDDVERVMTKEDGSLISTFLHNGGISFKSKGSISSEQALDSQDWFDNQSDEIKEAIEDIVMCDVTINFEWCASHNRIVLGYETSQLIILNIRDNTTGDYWDLSSSMLDELRHMIVNEHSIENFGDVKFGLVEGRQVHENYDGSFDDMEDFVNHIPHMEDIEGFVLVMDDGQMIKVKTSWYLARHRAKDSVNNPKSLFKAIIGQDIDDMIVMFKDDTIVMNAIEDMQKLVNPKMNHMIVSIENFYEENRDLIRKDYAIKAKGLDDGMMGLYMNAYLGKDVNYIEFATKHPEKFIGELL